MQQKAEYEAKGKSKGKDKGKKGKRGKGDDGSKGKAKDAGADAGAAGDAAIMRSDQVHGGLGGATGGNQIIDYGVGALCLENVGVCLQSVLAVFKIIGLSDHFSGQLPRFANQVQWAPRFQRQGGTKNKSPRFDCQ